MAKRPNPKALHRIARSAAFGVLALVGGYSIWVAGPVLAQALTPPPPSQSAGPATTQSAVSAALGAPGQPVVDKLAPPPPDVKAIAGGASDALAPPRPGPPPLTNIQGTPDGYQPGTDHACFQCNFDASKPILVQGKLTGVTYASPFVFFMITGADGKVYRIQGPRVGLTTIPEYSAQLDAAVGQDLTVKGYDARDTACIGGCLVNAPAQNVDFANGDPIVQDVPVANPPTCSSISVLGSSFCTN